MLKTRVFEVLEERGQKQRWLLAELERRGYRVSEGYLSQIKSGAKHPNRQFIDAVCSVFGMAEQKLFYVEGGRGTMAGKTTKQAAKALAKAGSGKRQKGKINVAIIGVGNCASSLVQGATSTGTRRRGHLIPGLMHANLGGYHISDINFVAAIDIDENKVGHDLSEAVFTTPNNTFKFSDVPHQGVRVSRGMTHDGLGKYLSKVITKAKGPTDDIVKLLKDTQTDVVVNYLPVGSEEATKWYVEQVLAAGCGFVNCIPVFIAREHTATGPSASRSAACRSSATTSSRRSARRSCTAC